ncbi:MAG: VIT domain-containing protein [Betaproteobacteria bacterium]
MNRLSQLAAATILFASALVPSLVSARSPMAQIWQPPRLVISSQTDAPVQMQSVKLTGDIRGRHAWTQIDMTFYNPNRRVLEGELQFPLLDGQHIAAFAMDVNGALREAVPVEKAKGQAVFEDVIRGRIDPGLLEVTQGNNFKLRVYPIPAQGTKRVVLRIEETLASRGGRSAYRLPLGFGDHIGNLSVDVRIAGVDGKPLASAHAIPGAVFERDADGYRLALNRNNFTAEGNATLDISTANSDASVTWTQTYEGRTYFIADVPLRTLQAARMIPKNVGIIWDSSGSGSSRDHGREFALLDAYFRRMGNGEVRLTRVRHDAEAVQVFRISNGRWDALRQALSTTPYDGATNLGSFVPEARVNEYLLFSDGISNFGDKPFEKTAAPVLAISAALKADTTFLRHIAHRSGGRFIDLTATSPAEAAQMALNAATRIASITSNQASQLVLASPYPNDGRVLLGGVLNENEATVRLTLAGAPGKARYLDVAIKANAGNAANALAAGQWARLRVAELEGEYAFNRAEIRRLGQRFKLVTRETSLIVLDRVEDYARFEIAPPAELRADYDRIAGNLAAQRTGERKSHLENIVRLFENKVRWWNRDFPKDTQRKKEAKVALGSVAPSVVMADSVAERRADSPRQAQEIAQNAATAGAARSNPVPAVPAAPASLQSLAKAAGSPAEADNSMRATQTATIRLQKWQPDSPYALRMREASGDELYRIYLDEKPGYAQSTAFFLDAADVFFDKGQPALGIRVLTNLAEMDLENRHILRIMGYRLMQAKQPAMAIPVFKKVLALSPEEPQSYRDLGLAYAADKQAQKAIDSLYEVVIRPWHNRFPEIELITLAELNAIVANTAALDTSRIDPRLLKNLSLDLRAVLTWDADNTDIDLWVTDPNGEKAYYGNQLTHQGGRMSMDFTGGYGPEEFSLKNAKPGKYKVEANYFGDRRQNVTGATTLSLKLSTHFGKSNQEDQIVTMRLKDRKEMIFVGEFEVK